MMRFAIIARLAFGGFLFVNGVNNFIELVPVVQFSDPLAVQLMIALSDSGLLAIAKAIQLLAGALLLAGLFVPFALAMAMPISTCVLYISLVLEGDLLRGPLALLLIALNGLLMLAYLPYYREVLRPGVLAFGESRQANYAGLYANPLSRTSLGEVMGALIVLGAAFAFYYWVVPFTNSDMGMIVLLFPLVIIITHLLRHAMGRGARPDPLE